MNIENKNPKIYLLSGKARSGKDLTSSLIHDIYAEKKLKCINLQYSSYIKEYAKKITNWDGKDETKPRELLQTLGTDIIRKNIDEKFFVNRIIGDIQVYSYFYDVITISDCRAKIEIDIPKENFSNVFAIRIERPNFDNGLKENEKRHFTEIDLDDYEKFDYYLINDSSIEQLKSKVLNIIEEVEHGK